MWRSQPQKQDLHRPEQKEVCVGQQCKQDTKKMFANFVKTAAPLAYWAMISILCVTCVFNVMNVLSLTHYVLEKSQQGWAGKDPSRHNAVK